MTARDGTGTGPHPRVAPEFDVATPSLARVNDYALGGKDNYQVDRDLHDQILAMQPEFDVYVRANRRFALQALTRMAGSGIDQFVVLGAGLPVAPDIHEVVRRVRPDARVVYVEPEPMVAAHARALLARVQGVVAVQHEVDDPVAIITDPRVAATIDPSRPLGVYFGLMQVTPQPAAVRVMAFHRDKFAAGSVLALSALVDDTPGGTGPPPGAGSPPWGDGPPPWGDGPPHWGAGREPPLVVRLASRLVFRSSEQVGELFAGLHLLEPGLRDLAEWARLPAPFDSGPLADVPHRLGGLGGLARVA